MSVGFDGPTPGYRPCVGLVLLNEAGEVFVGRRNDTGPDQPEAWQLPQGGIEDGETPREAAFRELAEEVGTRKAEVLSESTHWFDYDLPPDIAGKKWRGRFKGQSLKWFALRFLGADSDIDIETEHPEFDAWRWAPLDDVPGLIVDFKRAHYERVAAAFRHLIEDPDELEID